MIDGLDPASPTWRALRKEIEARIEIGRNRLELRQDAESTALERGRISAFRHLIEAAEERPWHPDAERSAEEPSLY